MVLTLTVPYEPWDLGQVISLFWTSYMIFPSTPRLTVRDVEAINLIIPECS